MIAFALSALLAPPSGPAEIAALGKVRPFVDATPETEQVVVGYTLTDDGTRVYRAGPLTPLYTWKIGEEKVLTTDFAAAYDPERHRPLMRWAGARAENNREAWLHNFRLFVGLLDANRPLAWQSGIGKNGIVASSLGWIDLTKQGPSSWGLLLFERKRYEFVDLDVRKRIVFVVDHSPQGTLRAFKLGANHRAAREIPVPARMRRASLGWRNRSRDWTWTVTGSSEVDLRTGKAVPIPKVSARPRYFTYVGEDLFFSQEVLVRRPNAEPVRTYDLWTWDRKRRRIARIGRYDLSGTSANGRFMVLTENVPGNPKGGRRWLVDRNS